MLFFLIDFVRAMTTVASRKKNIATNLRQVAITSFFSAQSSSTVSGSTSNLASAGCLKRKLTFVEEDQSKKHRAEKSPSGNADHWNSQAISCDVIEVYNSSDVASSKIHNVGVKKRECPFYKRVPESTYVVDAFSYGSIPGVSAYFLSHFHADHYGGLTKSFSGVIYCSQVTANLVKLKLRVNVSRLRILPLNTAVTLPCSTQVVALDSNHCPGATLFLFKLRSGRFILHSGDMRSNDRLLSAVKQWLCGSCPDVVYLDTTYLNPRYQFPSQETVIRETVEYIRNTNTNTIVACGAYTVGKEKIFSAIADSLQCRIAVSNQKMDILRCLDDAHLAERLTTNFNSTRLHVVSMNAISFDELGTYLQKYTSFSEIVGICPSGWEFRKRKASTSLVNVKQRGCVRILGVPYSEHSSFDELQDFVQNLKPKKIIPTVNNGNEKSRGAMSKVLASWQ